MSRFRISGRHFSIVNAIRNGAHVVAPSEEHIELEAWGYIAGEPDGAKMAYRLTEAGAAVYRTWTDMKDLGQ